MKSRSLFGFCVAVAMSLYVAGPAMAQTPAWAVGTWKGHISNYRNDPDGAERVLVVRADGTCKWDYLAKTGSAANAKSCSIAGDTISILTGGNSTVQLQHRSGKLDGTFQTRHGTSYHVSLTKQ